MIHEFMQQAFLRSYCVSCAIRRPGELVENKTAVASIFMDLNAWCRLQMLDKHTHEYR